MYLFKYVWNSYGTLKSSNVKLFIVLVFSATLEGVGLAILLPLMQLLTGQSDGLLLSLVAPLLALFDEKYSALILTVLVAAMLILKHLTLLLVAGYSTYVVMGMRNMWRRNMMNYYLYSLDRFVQKSKQGELMENIIQQPRNAAKLARYLLQFMREFIFSIAMCTILILTSWQISLVVLVLFSVVGFLSHGPIKRYTSTMAHRLLKLLQKASDTASENIAGIREIKLMSLEQSRLDMFLGYSQREALLAMWLSVVDELPNLVGTLLIALLLLCSVAVMTILHPEGLKEMIPLITLFILVGVRLNGYATSMIRAFVRLRMAIPAFKLVSELASKTNLEAPLVGEPFTQLKSDIIFENVSFSYNGKVKILKNFNLIIARGKFTALTGSSGQGKSTVIQLLTGEVTPQSGKIIVNGRVLSDFSPSSWKYHLGVVTQDAFLFNTTVRENIAMAKPDATEEEILKAARLANAHDFIAILENGYDTNVGDRGSLLSGGQRQRIAIARAILKGCELYIFDEATNAQDVSSRDVILKTMKLLREQGKTVLMVSHQSEMLEHVDIICKMERSQGPSTPSPTSPAPTT